MLHLLQGDDCLRNRAHFVGVTEWLSFQQRLSLLTLETIDTRQRQWAFIWEQRHTLSHTHRERERKREMTTCSLIEHVAFGEERSSISDPLDPEDETLIWSAGSFLAVSLTDLKLRGKISLRMLQQTNWTRRITILHKLLINTWFLSSKCK